MQSTQNKRLLEAGCVIFCFWIFLTPLDLLAATSTKDPATINWFTMVMQLAGGLCLFLYGMEKMSDSLKAVAGDRMKDILAALSNNRFMGMVTGAIVTAIIQSSSVTTVMLVGFVSANLMSLTQTIGVIFGANIGTTITGQIIAFKVTKYALIMVSVGFVMMFTSKKEEIKHYGYVIMGLGLVFYGMSVMGSAMRPLRSYPLFIELMSQMSNPILGILFAAAFTAIVQSSSATTGVIITMAQQGLITLDAGIALALGANIGTCITAGFASIGKPREAVRVAIAHVFFNTGGILLILPILKWGEGPSIYANIVTWISPGAQGDLVGQAILADTVPRQVANAHTMFNVGIAILFLPLTTHFARLVHWLLPDRPKTEEYAIIEAYNLDKILLTTPSLALDAVRREIQRMGEHIDNMLTQIMPVMIQGTYKDLNLTKQMAEPVNILHKHILTYLGEIGKLPLNQHQIDDMMHLIEVANDIDNIGDVIEIDLVNLGHERIANNVTVNKETKQILTTLHTIVTSVVKIAIQGIVEEDYNKTLKVYNMNEDINRLVEKAEQNQAKRMIAEEAGWIVSYTIETDFISRLKRIYYHSKRMVRTKVEI